MFAGREVSNEFEAKLDRIRFGNPCLSGAVSLP